MKVGCEAGWRIDGEEEAERKQQQRQRWRKSQVQQEEGALEGAAGVPAGGHVVERHHRRGCKQWRYREVGRILGGVVKQR